MASILQDESPDCTDRCKSTQHGDVVTAAISRRSVSDVDLCSYLNYTCTCCESVRDSVGRTALHVAASCGRIDLVRYLAQCRHANINAKDEESGFTALHRSIFYGKINVTVELIKLGANTALMDFDGLTMLEHAMKDGFIPEMETGGELYVWGSNTNYSLGPHQSRSHPELLDVFHKKFPDVQVNQIYVEKFHSVILTSSGKAYSCGHGQGGRLGLGNQQTVVIPELITFPESNRFDDLTCLRAAISRNHSIFLNSDNSIYTCGLNTHRALGLNPPPQQVLVPTHVRRFADQIKDVCAGQYHSVVWGPRCIYTWGLNAGQLGHKMRTDEKYVIFPKAVTLLNFSETNIVTVSSSDAAISVYTNKGDLYIFHEYQCRKIASRQLNLVQIAIFGGKLDSSACKDITTETPKELKVVAVTNTGNLLLWQQSDPQLSRCIFSLTRAIIVKQVTINSNELLFVTEDGEAFQGFVKPRKKKTTVSQTEKSAFHKFLEQENCICIKLVKFPKIHRAIYISSDANGHDYCVVQARPYMRFRPPEVSKSEMAERFTSLLNTCDENDGLHDVVFKVQNKYFPAHRYIMASKSSYFEKLLMDSDKIVVIKDFNPLIFEEYLLYTYTGNCDLLKCGECPEKFKNLCEKSKTANGDVKNKSDLEVLNNKIKQEVNLSKLMNPVRMLQEMAKKFGCTVLNNALSRLEMHGCVVINKTGKGFDLKPLQFDNSSLSQYCDVLIKCCDGKTVRAHRCILAAQTDYFNNLFSVRWNGNEASSVTLPCAKSIVDALLEYLYFDTLSMLNNKQQDHLFKLLILADQLFITRLKEHCEFLLYYCLTLRNAVQFLIFSHIYNARKLKNCCLKFIVANIAPLLEQRAFDEIDEDLLKELSEYYFNEKSQICCRVITPYSTAPSEEEIISINTNFPVSLEEVERNTPKPQKRRSRIHKSTPTPDVTFQPQSPKEDLVFDDIQFPDSSEIVKSTGSSRLKAIKLAEQKIAEDSSDTQFVKLESRIYANSNSLSSSFDDFPLLGSPLNSPPSSSGKFTQKIESSKLKIVKVSQKQRRRLSSSENNSQSESPKNPWKIVSGCGSPQENSISDIISSEKKQKENLVKIRSKLLIHTQLEDKAIEELRKFYNTDDVMEEDITVERIYVGTVASPVWVLGVKKLD